MTPLFEVLAAIGAGDSHLAAVVARVDGVQLVADCARHGVSAYVARALRAGKLSLGDAQPALARHERHTIALAMKLRALVQAVLDTLAAQGVTPVLLKGSFESRYVVAATRSRRWQATHARSASISQTRSFESRTV